MTELELQQTLCTSGFPPGLASDLLGLEERDTEELTEEELKSELTYFKRQFVGVFDTQDQFVATLDNPEEVTSDVLTSEYLLLTDAYNCQLYVFDASPLKA